VKTEGQADDLPTAEASVTICLAIFEVLPRVWRGLLRVRLRFASRGGSDMGVCSGQNLF
jgi:hypothetical protein